MKSGVLFDLDETLLDRSASLVSFTQWQATKQLSMGSEITGRFVKRFVELDNCGRVWKDEVYRTLISEFDLTSHTESELLDSYEQKFRNFCKPREFTVQLLNHLRARDIPIGVVSNGKSPFQENNLAALNISEYLQTIVVSDAVGIRKPDPEIFLLACSKLGIEPATSVFIGDNPVSDIEGAAAVGMKTIYVPVGRNCQDSEVADFTLVETTGIASFVDKLLF